MNRQSNPPYFGQCLCGTIKYQVDVLEPDMGHCHCSMCRKFHGAAFATYGEVKKENFHWLAGQNDLKSYTGHNGSVRQFCQNCGSSMTFSAADNDGELVEIAMGTMDSDIGERPDAHIFTDYKAGWFKITDDLPKFKGERES